MNCACGKPGKVRLSYTHLVYCKDCFLQMILRRVRKDLRKRKVLKTKDSVCLLNDCSKEAFLAKWLLRQIFGAFLRIREVKSLRGARGKKITPSNLEREVQRQMQPFFTGNKIIKDDTVRFPTNLLEEEIIRACELLGYKRIKKDQLHPLLSAMEARYPGTYFGLYRSFEEIARLS